MVFSIIVVVYFFLIQVSINSVKVMDMFIEKILEIDHCCLKSFYFNLIN